MKVVHKFQLVATMLYCLLVATDTNGMGWVQYGGTIGTTLVCQLIQWLTNV